MHHGASNRLKWQMSYQIIVNITIKCGIKDKLTKHKAEIRNSFTARKSDKFGQMYTTEYIEKCTACKTILYHCLV